MTRCPKCAADNAETQRFCGDCGIPLPVDLSRPMPFSRADETIPLPSIDLAPGVLFARRYQTIEELGAGGMGRVYRVLDTKLNEEIALKVIRPDIASDRAVIARFAAELKLARQVVQRNVARMFDLNEEGGVPYITMEYVRGENLKRLIRKVGRLAPAQAVPIACQICDGLAEAHRLGIAHRDLKPQNIMIDEAGQAKIMDFGLARLLDQEGRDGAGARSGSPAYVAPEQIRGESADGRADLYSLGIVLYEMLTGRIPFRGDTVEAITDMHLYEIPEDPRQIEPAIPDELSRVVMRCLEKDPGARFQSAAELRQALGCIMGGDGTEPGRGGRRKLAWAAAGAILLAVAVTLVLVIWPPGRWKRAVAVLPVEDTGLEPANPIFLAGLQREVTDRLSVMTGLRVLPTFSVNSYDLRNISAPQIGRMLGAGYLVRMTLDTGGGRVSAKVYLIDAKRNVNPAPMTYDGDLTSYRALQDKLAVLAAGALGVELDPEHLKKFSRRGTDDIEAYGLFLEGMKLLDEGGEEAVRKAIVSLGRAVEIDPDYALGHWALGYAYENLYYCRRENKDATALAGMYEELSKASELDPSFAETNLGLGWYFFYKGDNQKAFESFRKALRLEPDGYIVNRDVGAFLRSLGLYKQAIPYLARAAELSPRDPQPLIQIAQCRLFLGECEKALTYSGKAMALRESDPDVSIIHAVLLVLTGRFDQAVRQIRAMERFHFHVERLPFLLETAEALRQRSGKPHTFTTGRPGVTPQGTYVYLAFGMKDEALANIEDGAGRGLWDGAYLYSYPSLVKNPRYKALRGDPRFEAILKRQKELYDKELKPFEKL